MKKNTKIVVQMVAKLYNKLVLIGTAVLYDSILYGATGSRTKHEAALQDRRAHTQ